MARRSLGYAVVTAASLFAAERAEAFWPNMVHFYYIMSNPELREQYIKMQREREAQNWCQIQENHQERAKYTNSIESIL